MIESPVRRQAGQVVPYDEMEAITDFCRERGIPTHLDGARLYMMSAATEIRPERYAALFDTVYVSLYKYLDAPFGAILAGTSEFTSDLYHDRRTFGASLATGGYLAAAVALNAIEGFEERFAAAMKKGVELLVGLNDLEGISVGRYEHGSNIFPVALDAAIDADAFIEALHADWVFVYPTEDDPDEIRFTINTTILRQSNDQLVAAFAKALVRSRGIA
jgi:threonine aldolase